MERLPHGIDQEAVDGLSSEEMAELLIAYAQENVNLETENERLQRQVASLTRSSNARLQYIRDVRGVEAAVRRFVLDPAISKYLPSMDDVMARLFGDPIQYGGDHDD